MSKRAGLCVVASAAMAAAGFAYLASTDGSSRVEAANIPSALDALAQNEGVTDTRTLAVSPSGRAAVAAGVREGEEVSATLIDNWVEPFTPPSRLFANSPLFMHAANGGSKVGSAEWSAVAGIAEPGIAQVEIAFPDGRTQAVTLSKEGAFAVDVDPGSAAKVLAYDSSNRIVASADVPAPDPPGAETESAGSSLP